MKYTEMFRFGAEALERAGVREAELDARLLLETVCHTSRNDLLVHGDREITEEQNNSIGSGLPFGLPGFPCSILPACRSSWGWNFQ